MNIFEIYLDKIKSIIIDLNKNNELIIPETFNGINAEIPPIQFDCDISTNVAMVLSKLNKKSPLDLAKQLLPVIKEHDPLIETISAMKPGFINIKFKFKNCKKCYQKKWIKIFMINRILRIIYYY